MEVNQKYVTTIRLHDAKGSEIHLTKKGEDYQLQLAAAKHVVNITLALPDLRRLCQQLVQLDMEENCKSRPVTPEYKSFFFNGTPRSFSETMAAWFAKMAQEMCESTGKN